ncbi:MAG: sigma-70 family RNA polymerase sigma factor [Isosphaeraceae bacterium]|nr:sigma-70 family RNA polymerase sigma factor [Isosphaeraceae bacterium]
MGLQKHVAARVEAVMTEDGGDTQALVDSLRRGDSEPLAALVSLHRERLRRMVEFRLDVRLRGRVSTSDVLQEAYIDALKRLPHFAADPDVPFYVWLRTVTIQRLIQVHRQHLGAQARDAAREVSIGRSNGTEASSEKMAELMGDLTSPSHAAERGEMRERVRGALERLEAADREVLALRHFEELSNLEVAALLGIQPAAASKRYVRAIERLKNALEAGQPGHGGAE